MKMFGIILLRHEIRRPATTGGVTFPSLNLIPTTSGCNDSLEQHISGANFALLLSPPRRSRFASQ